MTDAPDGDEQSEDAKEKYRQAMERKKSQGWSGVGGEHHDGGPKVKDDTHKHGGGRDFRRKSG